MDVASRQFAFLQMYQSSKTIIGDKKYSKRNIKTYWDKVCVSVGTNWKCVYGAATVEEN